jgi:hypothetical protein
MCIAMFFPIGMLLSRAWRGTPSTRVRRRSTWPVLEVLARIGAVRNQKYNTRYYVGDSISYMDQKVQYMYQKLQYMIPKILCSVYSK